MSLLLDALRKAEETKRGVTTTQKRVAPTTPPITTPKAPPAPPPEVAAEAPWTLSPIEAPIASPPDAREEIQPTDAPADHPDHASVFSDTREATPSADTLRETVEATPPTALDVAPLRHQFDFSTPAETSPPPRPVTVPTPEIAHVVAPKTPPPPEATPVPPPEPAVTPKVTAAPAVAKTLWALNQRRARQFKRITIVNGIALVLIIGGGWFFYYRHIATAAAPPVPPLAVVPAATATPAPPAPAAVTPPTSVQPAPPPQPQRATTANAPDHSVTAVTETPTPTDNSNAPLITVTTTPSIITHGTPQTNPVEESLNKAYRAFQSGEFDGAAEHWRTVLRQQPDHHDALLGLAAIAARQDDDSTARRLYQRVLAQNPGDTIARTGLSSLSGADHAIGESQIKLLLEREPHTAPLHFQLGGLYLSQQRWAEAQATFFEAARLEPRNADYAYNLAISLDHLGKREAAINHYRAALTLAQAQPANFARATVEKRLQQLTGPATGVTP